MFRAVPETHERGKVSSNQFIRNVNDSCAYYFRYKDLMFGDISAVCAFKRVPQLIALLQATVRKQLPTHSSLSVVQEVVTVACRSHLRPGLINLVPA